MAPLMSPLPAPGAAAALTAGRTDPSRSALLLPQTPAALGPPLRENHGFVALAVEEGKTEDTSAAF